jgi:hypothetical protein
MQPRIRRLIMKHHIRRLIMQPRIRRLIMKHHIRLHISKLNDPPPMKHHIRLPISSLNDPPANKTKTPRHMSNAQRWSSNRLKASNGPGDLHLIILAIDPNGLPLEIQSPALSRVCSGP